MKGIVFFVISVALIVFFGCGKDQVAQGLALPPITDTGANTFGCKINGNIWTPYHEIGFPLPLSSDYGYDRFSFMKIFSINARNGRMFQKSWIELSVGNVKDTGIYFINNTSIPVSMTYYDEVKDYNSYGADNYVRFTRFDTIKKIFSGTFLFSVRSDTSGNPNTKFRITEGQFDVH